MTENLNRELSQLCAEMEAAGRAYYRAFNDPMTCEEGVNDALDRAHRARDAYITAATGEAAPHSVVTGDHTKEA